MESFDARRESSFQVEVVEVVHRNIAVDQAGSARFDLRLGRAEFLLILWRQQA